MAAVDYTVYRREDKLKHSDIPACRPICYTGGRFVNWIAAMMLHSFKRLKRSGYILVVKTISLLMINMTRTRECFVAFVTMAIHYHLLQALRSYTNLVY